jgi:hypothetical protein
MPLIRLNTTTFSNVVDAWTGQCRAFDEDFDDFAPERIAHAKTVSAEEPADPRYGIFALQNGAEFDAIMHLNRAALPGTSGHTLRVVWVLLAPKFDFGELSVTDLARLTMEIIFSAIDVSQADLAAEHIKIHLGNFADKQFFSGVASGLQKLPSFNDVRIRGNWFHLSKR